MTEFIKIQDGAEEALTGLLNAMQGRGRDIASALLGEVLTETASEHVTEVDGATCIACAAGDISWPCGLRWARDEVGG